MITPSDGGFLYACHGCGRVIELGVLVEGTMEHQRFAPDVPPTHPCGPVALVFP